MINHKKLKNIIKYYSFIEIALNNNVIFAYEVGKETLDLKCSNIEKIEESKEEA